MLSNGSLLYSAANPTWARHSERRNMTVFISDDDAASWRVAKNIYPGPSAYSGLAQLQDGTVVIAYERDVEGCAGIGSIEWATVSGSQ
jgi:sialidase-1